MEPNRIICTHRPSHCHSARIFSWSTPSCVYIYEIFHGQGFSVVKEVQSTLWGIPVRLSSGWVCEVHECRLYSYALTLLYVLMLSHHVCKDTKKCCISQTFHGLFSFQKSSFFDSFDKLSFFAHISMINNILFLILRARWYSFYTKNEYLDPFPLSPTYHITAIW